MRTSRKLGLAGIVLGTTLTVVGCESIPDEGDAFSWLKKPVVLLGIGAVLKSKTPTDAAHAQRLDAAAQAAYTAAQYQAAKEAAQAGRDDIRQEVNVYPQQQNRPKVVEKTRGLIFEEEYLRDFFACNSIEDTDKDGIYTYNTEIKGIKKKFRGNENLILVAGFEEKAIGKNLELRIHTPKEIVTIEREINGYTINFGKDTGGTADNLIDRGGYGKYKVFLWVDNKVAGSYDFEIIE